MIIVNTKTGVFVGPEATTANAMANLKKIGCGMTEMKLGLNVSTKDLKESCSGLKATIASFVTDTEATINLSMFQFSIETLADALYGQEVVVAPGTVTDEIIGTVTAGTTAFTKRVGISALVIKDSTPGTPLTLAAGTNYNLVDAAFGRIEFVDVTGFIMPLKASFSYSASSNVKMLTQTGVVRSIVYEGTSQVDGTKMRVSLPRVKFNPTSEFNFISDEEASLKIEGKLYYSDIWAADPILGQYGKIEILS